MAFFDRFRANVERLQQERDYAGLAGVLDAEDPGTRADAARALAVLGVPAIPDLLVALENAGPASRTRMTEVLASRQAAGGWRECRSKQGPPSSPCCLP